MVEAQFIIKTSKARVYIPEFLKILGLITIFYILIRLNTYLIGIGINRIWNTIIILMLVALAIAETIIKSRKKIKQYYVYPDRITDNQNTVILNQAKLKIKKNFIDKIFNTETITLSQDMELKNILENNHIYAYLQNLIKYAKGEQYGT